MRTIPPQPWGQLLMGASYPWRAWQFMRQHNLWAFSMVPVVVALLWIAALSALVWWKIRPVLDQVDTSLQFYVPTSDAFYSEALHWALLIIWIIVLPLLLVSFGTIFLKVGQAFCSPWLEVLSEKVECLVDGKPAVAFGWRRLLDSIFLAVGDVFWGLLYLLLIYVPLLFLAFVPFVGGVVSFGFAGMLVTQQFTGHSLGRRMLSYRARWQLVVQNRWLSLGFGGAVLTLSMLPGLNLFLLPLATVGATLLVCDLKANNKLTVLNS